MHDNWIQRVLETKATIEACQLELAGLFAEANLEVGFRWPLERKDATEYIQAVVTAPRINAAEGQTLIDEVRQVCATAVPLFMSPAFTLERIEACRRAGGPTYRKAAEWVQQALDLMRTNKPTMQVKPSEGRIAENQKWFREALDLNFPLDAGVVAVEHRELVTA